MRLLFTPEAWEVYRFWVDADRDTPKRLNDVIENARRTPFVGIGKPEPLKGEFSGWWSRRITREHRLVYKVEGSGELQTLVVASCRFHYFEP
ncbi:MAG: Txe/YoeB family addiction module toxin [Rhizobiaceae bacterium]|nr:Txe/YoeB family addiction module toxin [Rhizobiaceae bacterium]